LGGRGRGNGPAVQTTMQHKGKQKTGTDMYAPSIKKERGRRFVRPPKLQEKGGGDTAINAYIGRKKRCVPKAGRLDEER